MASKSEAWGYRNEDQSQNYSLKSLIKSVKVKVSDIIHEMLLQDCNGEENRIKDYLNNIHSDMIYSTDDHTIEGPYEAIKEANEKLIKLLELLDSKNSQEKADNQRQKLPKDRDGINFDDRDRNVDRQRQISYGSSSTILPGYNPLEKLIARGGNNRSYRSAVSDRGHDDDVLNVKKGGEIDSFEDRKVDQKNYNAKNTESDECSDIVMKLDHRKLKTKNVNETVSEKIINSNKGAAIRMNTDDNSYKQSSNDKDKSINVTNGRSNGKSKDVIRFNLENKKKEASSMPRQARTSGSNQDLNMPGIHKSSVEKTKSFHSSSTIINHIDHNQIQNTKRRQTYSESSDANHLAEDKSKIGKSRDTINRKGSSEDGAVCSAAEDEITTVEYTEFSQKIEILKQIDVSVFRQMIENDNKITSIRFSWNDNTCNIIGPNLNDVRKTKEWLEYCMKNCIEMKSCPVVVKDDIISDSVLECRFCESKGCFATFRWLLSKLSYDRLNFCHKSSKLMIYFKDNKAKDKAKRELNEALKKYKSSKHFIPPCTARTCMLQKVGSDLFLEFISDEEYVIVGNEFDKDKFEKNCRGKAKGTNLFKIVKYVKAEGSSLEVNLEHAHTLSTVSFTKHSIVIFGCKLEQALRKFGLIKFLNVQKSSLKISENIRMLSLYNTRLYFVNKSIMTSFEVEKELKDLYRTALYTASDGAKSLTMTLTMTDKWNIGTSVFALCDTIKCYDLGERVHDNLKKITILSKDQSHLTMIKDCFSKFVES